MNTPKSNTIARLARELATLQNAKLNTLRSVDAQLFTNADTFSINQNQTQVIKRITKKST